MIEALLLVTAALLCIISLIALINAIVFPRLRPVTDGAPLIDPTATMQVDPTFISVCIPARNEAHRIGATVEALLAQDHPAFEVILLDDGSTDGTTDAALYAARGDVRLRVLRGQPLPAGWLGKNWACHQLSMQARGRILVFSDADVLWAPGALRALAAMMVRQNADLLTVWPTQITGTLGERLVVPLMAFVIFGYLPLPLVHYLRTPAFAAANGQCLAFRRRAYDRVGGHMAVKTSIVEDIRFARLIKAKGFRLRMVDGGGMISCRMYSTWSEVRDGFAKNIIAGYGGLAPFLLGVLFHWLILLFPWWALLRGIPEAALLIALGIVIRMLTAAVTRQRLVDALLLPISALLMTVISVQAVWWHLRGGPRWKGRIASV
ncbi:MAG: glycosyltransferase [Chloroflexi bacterium]|nr:glycosyltransferase [Chloroflexota bacterium]